MKQLLLVEDDTSHEELICRALEDAEEEYSIRVETNLASALACIEAHAPDIAIVDYHLPDGSGKQILKPAQGHFPVVFLTAHSSEQVAVDLIKAGALDYVVKSPDGFASIQHVLARALREWSLSIENKRAQQALLESEARFRLVLESTPNMAVQGYSPDGVINFWNPASQTIYGYSSQEAVGKNLLELIFQPEMRLEMQAAISQMTTTGKPIPSDNLCLLRKDGSKVFVFASHVVVRNMSGAPQLFCLAMDLTTLRQAENERFEIERRLMDAQKLESLGVLAGGIAHDFNNLLTAILGNLDLAMMDTPGNSPARESLLDAIKASRHAADLTRQMLSYSGHGTFFIKKLNLSELVEEMAELLNASISKLITLDIQLDRQLPFIQADAAQLQQVVMSLITNASEAIGDKNGSIQIKTGSLHCDSTILTQSRLREKNSPGLYVYLDVVDTGCGMNEVIQQRIFEPFFTTKFTGRGLGMAAVLGVIRGHKGAILVSSQPGCGTTMKVLFPASPAPCPRTDIKSGFPAVPPQPVSPGIVLVADDEPPVLSLAERTLQRAGYKVLCARNGFEAIELFKKHSKEITCAIIDLSMPQLDGASACQELRKLKHSLILMLASGYDEREVRNRFSDQGIDCFIQKPYSIEALLKEVARLHSLRQSGEN